MASGAYRRRADRGAAAVEGAMIGGLVVAPLLAGVLFYGDFFWKAQKVGTLSVEGIPPESVSGTYTCAELVDRVKDLLGDNLSALASQVGIDPSLIQTVVHVVPTAGIGADISVTYTVPLVDNALDFLPLPNDGALITDFTQRLENVKVTTTSC